MSVEIHSLSLEDTAAFIKQRLESPAQPWATRVQVSSLKVGVSTHIKDGAGVIWREEFKKLPFATPFEEKNSQLRARGVPYTRQDDSDFYIEMSQSYYEVFRAKVVAKLEKAFGVQGLSAILPENIGDITLRKVEKPVKHAEIKKPQKKSKPEYEGLAIAGFCHYLKSIYHLTLDQNAIDAIWAKTLVLEDAHKMKTFPEDDKENTLRSRILSKSGFEKFKGTLDNEVYSLCVQQKKVFSSGEFQRLPDYDTMLAYQNNNLRDCAKTVKEVYPRRYSNRRNRGEDNS